MATGAKVNLKLTISASPMLMKQTVMGGKVVKQTAMEAKVVKLMKAGPAAKQMAMEVKEESTHC